MATRATIRSRRRGVWNSPGVVRSITMPAGVQPGDQLFVCFVNDDNGSASTISSGWQRLATRNAGSLLRMSLFWKVATGSDSLIIFQEESEQAAYIAICVEGGSGDEPTVGVDYDSDSDDTAEFDGITGLAAGDYLSLLFVGTDASDGTDIDIESVPSGWGNLYKQQPSTTSGVAVFSMDRELTGATSVQPSAAGLSDDEQWVSFNVVVPPTPFNTIEGTAATDLGGLTGSATGTREVVGDVEAPLGGLTAAATGTVDPKTHIGGPIGDIVVEGPPTSLTRYLPVTDPGDVVVEGPEINVSHVVRADPGDVAVEPLKAEMYGTRMRAVDVEVEGLPIQVSYGSNAIGGRAGLVAIPPAPTTRFIVQRIRDGEFLHWDLPLADAEITYELSGPMTITGRLRPEDPGLVDLMTDEGLQPWACWLHVETDGLVRASGILQPYQLDGEEYMLEAVGVSAYPHGMPYLDELEGIRVDPADVIRSIWTHLQSYPDGDLGVTVVGTTPIRIGEEEPEEDVEYEEGERPAGPYKLSWWEGTDCGREIDNLANECGFDYVERCEWLPDKSGVKHWIELGYPRIGTRRFDLRFATGENIIGNPIPAEESDELFASQIIFFGKGEGRDTIRGYAGLMHATRIRRAVIIQDRTVDRPERANAIAKADLERRQGLLDVTDIEIDARHENARIGTFQVGDDILIDVEIPWAGRVQQWERILSITYTPDSESVRLQVRRADAGWYGGQPQ